MSRYDGQERPVPVLDVLYPYAGSCAFCGFGDKRHRLADALVDYPGTPERTAESWGWPEDQYAGVNPEAIARKAVVVAVIAGKSGPPIAPTPSRERPGDRMSVHRWHAQALIPAVQMRGSYFSEG